MHLTVMKALKHVFTSVDDVFTNYKNSFENLKNAFNNCATLAMQKDVFSIASSLKKLAKSSKLHHTL